MCREERHSSFKKGESTRTRRKRKDELSQLPNHPCYVVDPYLPQASTRIQAISVPIATYDSSGHSSMPFSDYKLELARDVSALATDAGTNVAPTFALRSL